MQYSVSISKGVCGAISLEVFQICTGSCLLDLNLNNTLMKKGGKQNNSKQTTNRNSIRNKGRQDNKQVGTKTWNRQNTKAKGNNMKACKELPFFLQKVAPYTAKWPSCTEHCAGTTEGNVLNRLAKGCLNMCSQPNINVHSDLTQPMYALCKHMRARTKSLHMHQGLSEAKRNSII